MSDKVIRSELAAAVATATGVVAAAQAASPAVGATLGVGAFVSQGLSALAGRRAKAGLDALAERVDDAELVLAAIQSDEPRICDIVMSFVWASTRCSEEKLAYLANAASNSISRQDLDSSHVLMILDIVDRMTVAELVALKIAVKDPQIVAEHLSGLAADENEHWVTLWQQFKQVFGSGLTESEALMVMHRLHTFGLTFALADDMMARKVRVSELGQLVYQFVLGPVAVLEKSTSEARSGPAPAPVEAVLELLDSEPEHVCGTHAFVLLQPDIGRVEVGNPLPDAEIWNHRSGDLRYTVVAVPDGGLTAGGGAQWEDDKLDVMWSEPGSGDGPSQRSYVVVGQVPELFPIVAVDHDGQRWLQSPIHRTAVLPLHQDGSRRFSVIGIEPDGSETVLFKVD